MPPQNLTSEQIAAVLTYVYKNWGNSGKTVTAAEVEKLKGTAVVSK
jgi:mono/diheme cytochrome c family protein